jgi:hypothetical protein
MVEFQPFIYGLIDPLDPGHIRYVGMAPSNPFRPHQHRENARRPNTKPSHLIYWIRKLHSEGRTYQVKTLETLSSPRLLGFVEKCYIDSLRKIGHDLTNGTEGGVGGNTGYFGSDEHRALMKMVQTGRKRSPETRALMAKAKRERPVTLETRAKLSAVLKGRKFSPEVLAKRSATLRARTPEQIQDYVEKCRATRVSKKAKDD